MISHRNRNLANTYAYFKKYHPKGISRLLPTCLPETDICFVNKGVQQPERPEFTCYFARESSGLEIQVDYPNGGYGYKFTPEENATVLEFLYSAYN